MSRVKRAVDYINALCSSSNAGKRMLGVKLKGYYNDWVKTLELHDFLRFMESIQASKNKIGVPQFFGKFRAYAFEEYIYRLLASQIRVQRPMQLFWGEKCVVWQNHGNKCVMEFDVSIGKKDGGFVDPAMVFEVKVELDSARLKTALASFMILKTWKPKVKCALVYLIKDLDLALLKLAEHWVDGIFQFSPKSKESDFFIEFVNKCLSSF